MAIPFLKYSSERIERRRLMSSAERALDDHQHMSFLTNLGLGIALVIGFVVIYLHGGGRTAAIAAFGAALGSGGLLGFLFGVPGASKPPVTVTNARSVAIGTGSGSSATSGDVNPAPADTDANTDEASTRNTAPSQPNTSNLEQVADWVTKLLLGGGLTQMQRIPPLIWKWAQIVAWGVVGDANVSPERMQAERAFGAGLLVYGFLLGFFSGYLITKLQLGKAISE